MTGVFEFISLLVLALVVACIALVALTIIVEKLADAMFPVVTAVMWQQGVGPSDGTVTNSRARSARQLARSTRQGTQTRA